MIAKTAVALYQSGLELPQPAVATACFYQILAKNQPIFKITIRMAGHYLPAEEISSDAI